VKPTSTIQRIHTNKNMHTPILAQYEVQTKRRHGSTGPYPATVTIQCTDAMTCDGSGGRITYHEHVEAQYCLLLILSHSFTHIVSHSHSFPLLHPYVPLQCKQNREGVVRTLQQQSSLRSVGGLCAPLRTVSGFPLVMLQRKRLHRSCPEGAARNSGEGGREGKGEKEVDNN
jgi:hypothetical protein